MAPKVSVIVPNYNHSLYLKQRLDSILTQTFQDFEVIILDDKSTDGSAKIIEQYRQNHQVKHIEYNAKNSGSTFAQWEKGLHLAKGEWIWIAESDDYAAPFLLEKLLALIAQNDNVGIAYGGSHWVDDKSEERQDLTLYHESFFKPGAEEVKQMCIHCTIQNASSALIRKDLALDAIKGLSRYRACGDWIFYTRILHHSNIAFTAEKVNYFRWYHNNVSSASRNNLWATEGIQVLENVDYKKIKFSWLSFFILIKGWALKTPKLGFNDSLKTWHGIFNAYKRFLFS